MRFTFYKISIGVMLAMLTLYIGSVSYYNTKICDDICAVDLINKLNFGQYFSHIYNNWEGSYTQIIVSYMLALYWNTGTLFTYSVTLIVLTITALYLFNRFIISQLKQITKNDHLKLFAIAALSFLALFYGDTEVASSGFVWLTGSYSYVLSMCFLLLGLYLCFQPNNSQVVIGLLLLFLFAGFRLNYTLYVLLLITLVLLINLITSNNSNTTVYILIISVLLVGLLIYLKAPGNAKRALTTGVTLNGSALLHKVTSLFFWKCFAGGMLYMIKVHLVKSSFFSTLICCSYFILFNNYQLTNVPMRKLFIYSLSALIIVLISHVFLMTLIMNGPGPSRTYVFIYFLKTATIFTFLYYIIDKYNLKNNNLIMGYTLVSIGVCAVAVTKFFIPDLANMQAQQLQKKERASSIAITTSDTLHLHALTKCAYLPIEDNCIDFDPRLTNKIVVFDK